MEVWFLMGGHILEDRALQLQKKYGLHYFVETGTWRGGTTNWAAQHFNKVWTIEADKGYYEAALERIKNNPNITAVFGDSGDQLREVLKRIKEPALLWLDAHWCRPDEYERHAGYDQCPLVREMDVVRLSGVKHVLMIDDARLFLNPPPPPCDPSKWPTLEQIADRLPNYNFWTDRDVIVGEPCG